MKIQIIIIGRAAGRAEVHTPSDDRVAGRTMCIPKVGILDNKRLRDDTSRTFDIRIEQGFSAAWAEFCFLRNLLSTVIAFFCKGQHSRAAPFQFQICFKGIIYYRPWPEALSIRSPRRSLHLFPPTRPPYPRRQHVHLKNICSCSPCAAAAFMVHYHRCFPPALAACAWVSLNKEACYAE